MSFTTSVVASLSTRASVEILTTRSSGAAWPRNVFLEGHERVEGVHVRRFTCDRSTEAIGSYLETFGRRYDCVLFIGQLERIVALGLDRIVSRALVVPFEVPPAAQVSENLRALLRRVPAFVFPSANDRLRVQAIDGTSDGPVASGRIVAPSTVDPKRFRSRSEIYAPFFLVPHSFGFSAHGLRLLENFSRYRRETGSKRKLVFFGNPPPEVAIPDGVEFVRAFAPEEIWDAMAASEAAIVVDEAEGLEDCWKSWSIYKAVITDSRAERVVNECRRSGGGLWYEGPEEFTAILEMADEDGLRALASQGYDYLSEYRVGAPVAQVLSQFFDSE